MLLPRLLLGAVFVLAGGAKVADRGWIASAREFGLSRGPAWLLPIAEILLGSMMLVDFGGAAVVACGIGLLGIFAIVLVLRLRGGSDEVVCACFGAWSRRPISWWTVARNIFLMILGLLAL